MACVFNILPIFYYFLLQLTFILVVIKSKNPTFWLCKEKNINFSLKSKPYFSVVQTLLFGCANPTFRLCKPYFSVVQTLLFGCAIKIESLNHACLRGVKIAPIYIIIVIIERESK